MELLYMDIFDNKGLPHQIAVDIVVPGTADLNTDTDIVRCFVHIDFVNYMAMVHIAYYTAVENRV